MNGSAYGVTDVGRIRDSNEDYYLLLPERNLYIVSDGMGGHNAGEVASLNAVEGLEKYFTPQRVSTMKENQEKIREEMIHAVVEAHKRVAKMGRTKAEYFGMGCTIAVAFISGCLLHTCHAGDSRVYIINRSDITQVTDDHSYVWELVKAGKMTHKEARQSSMKNRITQALGADFPISPEYNECSLNQEDKVLLCSDGLWDMLPDEEIQRIVMEKGTPEETCRRLTEKANEAGGDDNITVVLVEYGIT